VALLHSVILVAVATLQQVTVMGHFSRCMSLLFSGGIIGLLASTGMSAERAPAPKAKAPPANYTEKLTARDGKTTVNFDMVGIPEGEFLMGSPESEKGHRPDEGPQIKVKLKPFWIGKCEVTWDEFYLFYVNGEEPDPKKKVDPDSADAVTRPSSSYVDESYGHEVDCHPVLCITHHMAMKYCEWLSKKTGKTYRLPTEAEWEYACRAGTESPYGIPEGAKLDDYAWYSQNSKTNKQPRGTTHAVGTKKANAWGIHDMHGNVMEWCLDHYVQDAYARFRLSGSPVLQPLFLPTENKWSHVARGGHFKDAAEQLRSASREHSTKEWMRFDPQLPQSIWWLTNKDTIGFRVCRPGDKDDFGVVTSKVIKDAATEMKIFQPK
jgi:formylglycine-generating enzyme required for sulfatase activity